MIKNKIKLFSIILVFLSISSLSYFKVITGEDSDTDILSTLIPSALPNDPSDVEDIGINAVVPNDIETPGSYKTVGYFTQNNFVDLDENGEVFEYEEYDDLGSTTEYDYARFRQFNRSSNPDIFWHHLDTWGQLRGFNTINDVNYMNSTFFTPAFIANTYIQGEIHFMANGDVWPSSTNRWYLRVTVELYNSTDGQTTSLGSTSKRFDDTNNNLWSSYITLPSAQLILAGDRLRLTYECKLETDFYKEDSDNNIEIRSGYDIYYAHDWTIDSSNNTFDNTYYLGNQMESFGLQLYQYRDSYPEIDITGFTDNTKYYESTNATITVTDSITDEYKWDSEPSYTPFDSSVVVSLPETQGWYTLTVKSSDSYGNIAQVSITVGFDYSIYNTILHSPANNSIVTGGQMLNFTVYNVSAQSYYWDNDLAHEFVLNSPYDILLESDFSDGIHNVTIKTVDILETSYSVYFFDFDNSAPVITLDNVGNDTILPLGKNIDVEITDDSFIDVKYKWDSDSFTSWSPVSGDIYRTSLPAASGRHNLTVFANDTFGQETIKLYSFVTDTTSLLVELTNMVDSSYYLGGNTVEITITNDNATIFYFWGSDTPKAGIKDINNVLTLSGGDALATTPGTYTVTVLVGNSTNYLHEFNFTFTVDQEAPEILETGEGTGYNQSRFLDTTILQFTVTDNWTLTDNILIYISTDGKTNQTFMDPFNYYLNSLSEGQHNLTIIAYDIAGNHTRYFIEFIVDISPPEIAIDSISGLVTILDGSNYVPINSVVSCSMTDADPGAALYYSWNSSSYILFTDTFSLPSIEGTATLIVYSNDTLGKDTFESIIITIDNTSPTISLNLIQNNSAINEYTPLNFKVEDISDYTIDTITSQWNLEGSPSPENTEFSAVLSFFYSDETEAQLEIIASDIVGNSYSCIYNFTLDFDSPEYQLLGITNETYVRGNTPLDFNVISTDLLSFSYKWDNESDYRSLDAPYDDITIPYLDGNHTLYITLKDKTGAEIYTNDISAKYFFIVDDIEVNYIAPNDFTDNYYYIMEYGDSFTFSLDVRDTINNTEITNLTIAYEQEIPELNLVISQTSLNSTWYEFQIDATNVTGGEFKYIDFQFWQFEDHSESLRVYLLIHKDEGHLLIQDSSSQVVYGDNITISLKLNENTNTTALALTYISINDNIDDISYKLIDAVNFIYEISFASDDFISSKGNHLFEIYVESDYYFGVKSDTSSLSATILPVPIRLYVNVSSNEIVYGNDLVVYANLTRADGSPVAVQDIVFSIYIVNSGTVSTQAIPTTYDERINKTATTDANGFAQTSFEMTAEMEYVVIVANYAGNDIYDPLNSEYEQNVFIVEPPAGGLALKYIIIIIAGSALFSIVMGFVIYRVVRARPFEELMEKVTEEEIEGNKEIVSPGVILSLFDQTKGPTPLIMDHSLDVPRYSQRMRIGVENFLLKISDQAYSSLGFEDHDDRRRIGSINLPNEDMIGFIHGVQLENKNARGGFENLSLIVLADSEVGGFLLSNQEFLFSEIDELILGLKDKKQLTEIQVVLEQIRRRSVIIMLAAKNNQKKSKEDDKQYQ